VICDFDRLHCVIIVYMITSELELKISYTGIIVLCYLIFTDILLADVDDTELSKFLLKHIHSLISRPSHHLVLINHSTQNWRGETWESFIHVTTLLTVGKQLWGRLNNLEASSSVCSKVRITNSCCSLFRMKNVHKIYFINWYRL